MIALDTTAIIDLFKGVDTLGKVLKNTKEPFVTTQLNYLELMFGIDGKRHNNEESFYDKFFRDIVVYNLSNNSSKRASEIYHRLKKKGKMIDQFDCIIAGILITEGVNKIITRNVKHFSEIGLKVISY